MKHGNKTVWYATCDHCLTTYTVSRHRDADDDLPDLSEWAGIMGDGFTCLVCEDGAYLEGTEQVKDVFK